MRILTWNINGVRTLPQYHPWNTLGTFDDILTELNADIICFQEMKTSRSQLTKQVAAPPSFNAFFSFPTQRTGYSGVATYTRTAAVVPLKAEEGLCGIIHPKPPLSVDERVSPNLDAYPQQLIADEAEHGGDTFAQEESESEDLDWKALDAEGRAIVVDFGLFVLINVYCPNNGVDTQERDKYKMDFHHVLEARVKGLIEKEKREVIVVGDLNACSAIIDHCEGQLMVKKGLAEGLQGEEGFWGKAYRRRMKDWLVKEDQEGNVTSGVMVDILRRLWPDRKGMYTCWNTKISARETNYGTRIDYILITPGLLRWVKSGDIQPHIKGSDHCPVYLDLHEEITASDGTVVRLCDVLGSKPRQDVASSTYNILGPPRIAANLWDEFSGKQMMLDKFFGNRNAAKAPTAALPDLPEKIEPESSTSSAPPDSTPVPRSPSIVASQEPLPSSCIQGAPRTSPSPRPHGNSLDPLASSPSVPVTSLSTAASVKRKLTVSSLGQGSSKKKQKQKQESKSDKSVKGQAKLSTFFAKPKMAGSVGTAPQGTKSAALSPLDGQADVINVDSAEVDQDADHRFAMMLASQQEVESPSSPPKGPSSSQEAKQVWSSLLAPTPAPKCYVHGDPAKEYTVNKQGPNKGKRFFICSRPVGPGYDKGRAERLREHVDPQWRCDFFRWSSDVRRDMRKNET